MLAAVIREDLLSQSLTSRFGLLSNQLYSWVFRKWSKIIKVEPDSPMVKLGSRAVKILSRDKAIRDSDKLAAYCLCKEHVLKLTWIPSWSSA